MVCDTDAVSRLVACRLYLASRYLFGPYSRPGCRPLGGLLLEKIPRPPLEASGLNRWSSGRDGGVPDRDILQQACIT